MLGDMFLWLAAKLKQGVIYFIKQALPPNISAGSVPLNFNLNKLNKWANKCSYSFVQHSCFFKLPKVLWSIIFTRLQLAAVPRVPTVIQ